MMWVGSVGFLPLAALILRAGVQEADRGLGRLAVIGLLSLVCVGLWGFSVAVLWRQRPGRPPVRVVDGQLILPLLVRTVSIPLADIQEVALHELRSDGMSTYELSLTHRQGEQLRVLRLGQQLFGRDTLDQVIAVLAAHGVPAA